MSRNNLIGVIKHKRMYYVLANLNADTDWNYSAAVSRIGHQDTIAKRRWGQALRAAHTIQRAMNTEFGVWEIGRGE